VIHPAAAGALLLIVAGSAAVADPALPLTQPSRDVTVVYVITRGDRQIRQRSSWQAATGLQRVDAPGGSGYMIANRRAGTMQMVDPAAQRVIELQTPSGPLDGAAGFTRLGTRTIAGLPCTEWAATAQTGATTVQDQICLTADGVLLGIRAGDITRAQAVSVTYAPADPQIFTVPPGYKRVTPQVKAPISPL
jgi:hypothetical protein